jgi:WD40 repeat protein
MTRNIKVACLLSTLSMSAAIVQPASAQTSDTQAAASSAPVAFVYVSSTPGNGPNKINAFTAAANGKLTPVPGSPFSGNVTFMAVNGKYLFGSTKSGVYVAAFSIQPNGALRWSKSTNIAAYNTSGCSIFPPPLALDHTGATLDLGATVSGLCDSMEHQSFTIDKATGARRFLGSTSQIFQFDTPLSFSANNLYAYGTDCVNFQGNYTDTFHVYKRGSNGLLTLTAINPPTPPPPVAGDFYCRNGAAADPSNHLAVAVQPINESISFPDGPPQLATYTADSSGNLTTTSTKANMPASAVGFVFSLSMSPSGKLLAVSGANGLQIFHFNGSSPITPYTGLLTSGLVEQCFWDNANHLYAISRDTGKLRVFTITPTSHSQATGSPYSIKAPVNIIVQPR